MSNDLLKPPALILLERSGVNAMIFRRYVGDCPIVETRSWTDMVSEASVRPGSVLGVSVSSSEWAETAVRISQLCEENLKIVVIGIVDRNDFPTSRKVAVQLLYEFGCGFVVESPFDTKPAARFAVNRIKLQPTPPTTVTERVWLKMPWRSMQPPTDA